MNARSHTIASILGVAFALDVSAAVMLTAGLVSSADLDNLTLGAIEAIAVLLFIGAIGAYAIEDRD